MKYDRYSSVGTSPDLVDDGEFPADPVHHTHCDGAASVFIPLYIYAAKILIFPLRKQNTPQNQPLTHVKHRFSKRVAKTGRVSGGYDDATWDMYITEVEGVAYAYCLTPYAGGLDIATAGENYWATVNFGTNGEIIIPSQVCPGRVTSGSNTYYFCYTPCTEYDGSSWYYSSEWPDLVYTPTGTGTWESNYGVFAGGSTGTSISTFKSYFGVTAPTMTITKTSDTVPTALSSGRPLGTAESYTNLRASSAPASGTVSVTRALGRLPLGSAKPAR